MRLFVGFLPLFFSIGEICFFAFFALQALTSEHIVNNKEQLIAKGGHVVEIPEEIDNTVASLKCDALGIVLEQLTPDQAKYLSNWRGDT